MASIDYIPQISPAKVSDKIGYLALPGEICNQIMELVLLQGRIYLPTSPELLQDFFTSLPAKQ